jgi:hypothetical protein
MSLDSSVRLLVVGIWNVLTHRSARINCQGVWWLGVSRFTAITVCDSYGLRHVCCSGGVFYHSGSTPYEIRSNCTVLRPGFHVHRCGLCDNGTGGGNADSVVSGRFFELSGARRSHNCVLATGSVDV